VEKGKSGALSTACQLRGVEKRRGPQLSRSEREERGRRQNSRHKNIRCSQNRMEKGKRFCVVSRWNGKRKKKEGRGKKWNSKEEKKRGFAAAAISTKRGKEKKKDLRGHTETSRGKKKRKEGGWQKGRKKKRIFEDCRTKIVGGGGKGEEKGKKESYTTTTYSYDNIYKIRKKEKKGEKKELKNAIKRKKKWRTAGSATPRFNRRERGKVGKTDAVILMFPRKKKKEKEKKGKA